MKLNQPLVQLVVEASVLLILTKCIHCEPIATLASSPRIPATPGDDVEAVNSSLTSKSSDSSSVHWSPHNISTSSPASGSNISLPLVVPNATISSIASSSSSLASSSSSSSPSSASNVSATSSSPASPASALANHLPPPLSVISSFNAKGKFHSHSFVRER